MVHDTGEACIAQSRHLAFGNYPQRWYAEGLEWCEDALGSTLVWDLNYMEDRCSALRGFFKDESYIPSEFLSNAHAGGPYYRRKAYEVQLTESRIKYRLGRRFALLEHPDGGINAHDMYAMVPPDTEETDVVFVLTGATVPMVFRLPSGEEDYQLIGPWSVLMCRLC